MPSDEITLRVEDSGERRKRYWNLRDERRAEERDDRREERLVVDSTERTISRRDRNGSIYIDFDMEELREISEDQKKTILRTLLEEDAPPEDNGSKTSSLPSWPRDGFLPLIALMAFLAGLVTMFVLAGSRGCCY